MAKELSRLVGLFEGVPPALRREHVGGAPTGGGIETPVVLDHCLPEDLCPEGLVISGAVFLLQLVRRVEDLFRNAGQAGATVPLACVVGHRVRMRRGVDLECIIDLEHPAAGNRTHRSRRWIYLAQLLFCHDQGRGVFGNRH